MWVLHPPNNLKELARHAENIGAYAIGCMGPLFLPPTGVDELVGFCMEVASRATRIPFYYYHIPSVSGVKISMVEFIQKAKEQIPNLAGIKFTDNNFMDMQQCLRLDNGRWDILHGYDEQLLAGLVFGAKGAVGSTYNFIAPLYHSVIENFENGDLKTAREKQALTIKVVNALNKFGGPIAAGKALMKQVGVDCGPCRLPLKNLKEPNFKNFAMEIESIGVLKPAESGE
jgi:N-acetylneuraminate lyase